MIKIDEDIVQRIKVAGIFLLQVYKVTTGTMLSLFIPQACEDNKICSLSQNYNNVDPYHKTVFYWNCFAMLTFFTYYLIELRREEWAIKYLDIDNDKSDNGLKEIIRADPVLDKRMDRLNKYYYNTLMFNCGVYIINIGITAKMVKDTYHSSSTLSCFASFVLLVLMKLYNSIIVAKESVKNDKMMSAYMNEFVSFNVLDKDYLEKKEKQKNNENIQLQEIQLQEVNP
tara:strand:+ start:3663 stop:4346 length:684 start_codon:yes stop_codon:yes gene_type:complete